jgi:hypothetical protein
MNRTSPPLASPLLLGDEWEEEPRNNRDRIVMIASLIGVVLVVTVVALLQGWEPATESVWNPIPTVPATLSPDTEFRAAPVRPEPQLAVDSPSPERRGGQGVRTPAARAGQGVRTSPAVTAPGYLSINSSPWARVLVDGRGVGTTPQIRIRVTAGRHHLMLAREGFQTHTAWVTVPAGGTVRLTDIILSKIIR